MSFSNKNNQSSGSHSKRSLSLIGFALIWILFAGSFLFFGSGDLDGYICIGFFILIGVGLLVYAVMGYISGVRLGRPQLELSLQAVSVGETFTVNFFHTFPNAVDVESISIILLFQEKATYQQGTDTRTVTHNHEVQVFEMPAGHFSANSSIHEQYEIQIPPDAMHSLDVRRNKLQWFVQLNMAVANWPDVRQEYEIEVMPQLAGY